MAEQLLWGAWVPSGVRQPWDHVSSVPRASWSPRSGMGTGVRWPMLRWTFGLSMQLNLLEVDIVEPVANRSEVAKRILRASRTRSEHGQLLPCQRVQLLASPSLGLEACASRQRHQCSLVAPGHVRLQPLRERCSRLGSREAAQADCLEDLRSDASRSMRQPL